MMRESINKIKDLYVDWEMRLNNTWKKERMNNMEENKIEPNRIEVSNCRCGGGYILYTVYYLNKEVCTVHEYYDQDKKHIAEFILQQFIENLDKEE